MTQSPSYDNLPVDARAAIDWKIGQQRKPPALLDAERARIIQSELEDTQVAYRQHLTEKWRGHRHLLAHVMAFPKKLGDLLPLARKGVEDELQRRIGDAGGLAHPDHLRFADEQRHAILADPELVARLDAQVRQDIDVVIHPAHKGGLAIG